ncbi:MAG: cobalamin-binding protein [Dehalococcoidia bacterium]|nr:cobalamin-binding protein [Dehalococcoidia bacterium]
MKRLALVLLFSTLVLASGIACTPPSPGPGAIIDDLGRTLNIEETPQRIVSLAPSITEILFALDLGDKVVGVTDYCDYPEEARAKPSVGGYFMTNRETIMAQNPDIVFSDGHDPVCAQLEELGVTMVVLQPKDIAGIFKDIELVGEITGKEAEAEELVAEMERRIGAVAARTAGAERPTVFYEIDASNPAQPWTAGQGSFIDALITLAGGENMVKVPPAWFQISLEEIIASDPDIIILGDYPIVSPEDVMNRPGAWQGLSAVQNGAIYPIDPDLTSRAGPRIVLGLEALAKIIHPELFP